MNKMTFPNACQVMRWHFHPLGFEASMDAPRSMVARLFDRFHLGLDGSMIRSTSAAGMIAAQGMPAMASRVSPVARSNSRATMLRGASPAPRSCPQRTWNESSRPSRPRWKRSNLPMSCGTRSSQP